ncbi:hypothetical protein HK405_003246, partial [Cladochytrium tenue]
DALFSRKSNAHEAAVILRRAIGLIRLMIADPQISRSESGPPSIVRIGETQAASSLFESAADFVTSNEGRHALDYAIRKLNGQEWDDTKMSEQVQLAIRFLENMAKVNDELIESLVVVRVAWCLAVFAYKVAVDQLEVALVLESESRLRILPVYLDGSWEYDPNSLKNEFHSHPLSPGLATVRSVVRRFVDHRPIVLESSNGPFYNDTHTTMQFTADVRKEFGSGHRVILVEEPSGAGKSVAIQNLARELRHEVLSAFACRDDDPDSLDPNAMTLQLVADFCRVSGSFSAEFLQRNSELLQIGSVRAIGDVLVRIGLGAKPLVLIFDLEAGKLELADLLVDWHRDLPANIRFVLAVEPDSPVAPRIGALQPLRIGLPADAVERDMREFATDSLQHVDVPPGWDTSREELADAVVARSGRNFVWASLAVMCLQLEVLPVVLGADDNGTAGASDAPKIDRLFDLVLGVFAGIAGVDADILAKVLRELAATGPGIPRRSAPEIAQAVKVSPPLVAKHIDLLGPLVTYHPPAIPGGQPRIRLFHELFAAYVRRRWGAAAGAASVRWGPSQNVFARYDRK